MTAPAELSNRPAAEAAQPRPVSQRLPRMPCGSAGLGNTPALAFPWRARTVQLMAAVVVTLMVIGGLGWLGQRAAGTGAGVPAETTIVRVGAGETVWEVAQRVAPHADARAVVQRIRQLNGMVGSAVQPGQQLQVPDGR